jgi:ribosomal protein S18 acetylase RimI-like enzyme
MSIQIENIINKYKHKGYTGPKYKGLWGKIRLLGQGWLGHNEIVLCAERDKWDYNPVVVNPKVKIRIISQYEESLDYTEEMKNAFYRDIREEWKKHFAWGQILVIALIDERLSGFGWLQEGRKKAKCHYIKLQDGEFRALGAGVLPEYRNNQVHVSRHHLKLRSLFENGAKRVFVEAFEDNVYAWRGHLKAGYREIGRIHVKKSLSGNTYIRWI